MSRGKDIIEEKGDAGEEAAFRKRLTDVVGKHSVRGLARDLGLRYQNISRYLHGTQPPASFCRALVKKLGVNPAWLLTGEGSPMLADVTASTSATATDLLELVQAMEAVTRMRLGALAGKEHLKILRELNDALLRYDELRARLNAQSEATFRQIIKDLNTALSNRSDTAKAEPLIKAGEQIARLCEDPQLQRAFHRQMAIFHNLAGNPTEGSRLMRDVLVHDLFRGGELDEDGCDDAAQLAVTLRGQLRLKEASRVVEAALVFVNDRLVKTPAYGNLLQAAAWNDMDSGHLLRASERLSRVTSSADSYWRERATMPALAFAHFLSGSIGYEVAKAYSATPAPFYLAFIAHWTEQKSDLDDAVRRMESTALADNVRMLVATTYVRHLAKAVHGQSATSILSSFDDELKKHKGTESLTEVRSFVSPVITTQIAVLAGDHKRAASLFEQVDHQLQAAENHITLPVIFAAIHHRNALRLNTGGKHRKIHPARKRAVEFFTKYIDAGYAAFSSVFNEAEPAL